MSNSETLTAAISQAIGKPYRWNQTNRSEIKVAERNGKVIEDIAKAVPVQLKAWAAVLSREIGVKVEDIPLAFVTPCLNLTNVITRLPISASAIKKISGPDMFELGKILERQQNPAMQLAIPEIVDLYQEVFGRHPDAGGHAFWGAEMAKGMPLDQIRAHMMAQGDALAG